MDLIHKPYTLKPKKYIFVVNYDMRPFSSTKKQKYLHIFNFQKKIYVFNFQKKPFMKLTELLIDENMKLLLKHIFFFEKVCEKS